MSVANTLLRKMSERSGDIFFASIFLLVRFLFLRKKKMNDKMLQKIIELQEIIFYFCSVEIRQKNFLMQRKGVRGVRNSR